jgi:hypothetical protein
MRPLEQPRGTICPIEKRLAPSRTYITHKVLVMPAPKPYITVRKAGA